MLKKFPIRTVDAYEVECTNRKADPLGGASVASSPVGKASGGVHRDT